MFALAAGPAIRTGVHVRISLVNELLPPRGRINLGLSANLVALVVVVLIVFAMWVRMGTSFERNILATIATKTPLSISQMVVLWGMAQLWLDLVARALRLARRRC